MPPKHTAWLLGMGVPDVLAERSQPEDAAGASLISDHLLTALEGEAGKLVDSFPSFKAP